MLALIICLGEMTRCYRQNISEDKDAWLEARLGKIGSSNAYDILSEDGNPVRAFLDILGLSDPIPDNEPMYWGRRLESIVAEEFLRRYVNDNPGADANLVNSDHMYCHDKYDWMQATPDFFVAIDGEFLVLECKTKNAYQAVQYEDGIPEYPELQVKHQMAVLDNVDGAFVAALIFTPEFKYSKVLRNEAVLESIVQMEKKFYEEHIVTRKAPAPKEGDGKYLNQLYKESDDEIIELPIAAYALIEQYEEAKDREKECKAEKELAYNTLKQLVGQAAAGQIADKVVRWTHRRSRLTIDKANGALNDI